MKNQSGITLVALVITIIVLLILAGVSINLALGQNGVLTRASSAVAANERAKVLEELSMSVNESQTVYFEKMIQQATYRKSTPYFDKGDSTALADADVFMHNCMSAKTVVIEKFDGTALSAVPTTHSNEGIIQGYYESNGSGLFYGFKINVATGKLLVSDKGAEKTASDPIVYPTADP